MLAHSGQRRRLLGKTVNGAPAGLQEGVLEWSGGALRDDLALVLIEYHGDSGTEVAEEHLSATILPRGQTLVSLTPGQV